MSLPAADGLAVVYVLADEWVTREDLFGALGVKNRNDLDAILDGATQTVRSRDPQTRARQVAAMGGETSVGPQDR